MKDLITFTECESGDWEILELNLGEDFKASNHSISNKDWIKLLEILGYEVERIEISDEEMEKKY